MEASQLPGAVKGKGVSQLWSLVVVSSPSVFVLGGRGPVSFRAVKGKGGQSALELCSAGNGAVKGG